MNFILSVDERLIKQAYKVAQSRGKSLNQLICDYLETLVSEEDAQQDMAELRRLSLNGQGHSGGWRFNREDTHERA